jgi:hypothetical protein
LLASLALALGGAELALRALDVSYYWALAKRPDPERGWTPPPGAVAWQDLEGRARVQLNSEGFRDREHARAKPAGSLRLAVLGDSFVEAVQIPVEETFWSVMEDRLRGCEALAGRPVEVMSFGVSGYSNAQSLLTLRSQVWAYRPDVVLLLAFPGNDVVESSPRLDTDAMRPYLQPAEDGLVLDDRFRRGAAYRWRTSPPGRAWHWTVERSRLAQAAARARHVLSVRAAAGGEPDPYDEPGVDERVYRPPSDPDWQQAWQTTERVIATMNAEVRAGGARFVLATASTGAQVHPDAGFRAAFMKAHGIEDLFYPEDRLLALARGEGALAVGLARELHALASLSGAWLHGFANTLPGVGHWNALGHRLAGELLANSLCRDWREAGR